MKTIFFDLETKYTFEELGMRDRTSRDPTKLGLAVGGVLLSNSQSLFTEDMACQLLDSLATADLIVGHNLFRFDYLVLQPYSKRDLTKLLAPKTFDMMLELEKVTGCRIGLNDLAKRNIGMTKTEDSSKIPKMWRDGLHREVKDYLLNDLKLTEAIYNHGKKIGKFKYDHKDYGESLGEREVTVKW